MYTYIQTTYTVYSLYISNITIHYQLCAFILGWSFGPDCGTIFMTLAQCAQELRFNFLFFKRTIKSWGHSDAKNYYESDNACAWEAIRTDDLSRGGTSGLHAFASEDW